MDCELSQALASALVLEMTPLAQQQGDKAKTVAGSALFLLFFGVKAFLLHNKVVVSIFSSMPAFHMNDQVCLNDTIFFSS